MELEMSYDEIKSTIKKWFKENPERNYRFTRKDLEETEDLTTLYAVKLIRMTFDKARKRKLPCSTERLCMYLIDVIQELAEDDDWI